MPTVPRIESTVREQAIPNIRQADSAPIEAFGGGQALAPVAQAAARGLNYADQVFQEEKKKADDVATTAAYAEAVKRRNALMYDPKTGAMNRQGKDAFGVVDEYTATYKKDLDAIEEGLGSEDQKAMFKKIRLQQESDLNNDLVKHTFTESKKFDEQTTESGLAVTRDDAVLNYQNPLKVQSAIETQTALIKAHAERNGLPPEYVGLKVREAASKTHGAVIDRMLANGSDMEAKAYYEKVKDQISGTDSVTLEKNLEEGTRRGMAQRQSDEIYKTTSSLSTALEKARSIEDPKLRDDVTTRIKDNYSLKKLAENDRNEQLHKQAGNIIDQTGDTDKIPPAIWGQFTVSEKASLRAYAKNKREGVQPETNWDEYYNLKTQAATPALRSEFMQANLMTYRSKMADPEFKELVNLQTQLRTGDTAADKILDGYRSDQEIVNTALNEAGINPSPKDGTNDAKKVALFRRQVDQEVIARQTQTGKKVNSQEMQQIVDNLMVKGITKKGWIFDTRKAKFELEPGEKLEFTIKDVPATERAKIEQALTARKIPVTEEKIIELYTRAKGK